MDVTSCRAQGIRALTHVPRLFTRARPLLRVTALTAASLMALGGTAVGAVGNCYTPEGCSEEARSAQDFTASVGINTHLGYSQSVYWQDWPVVRDRLLELGVSHIRDGTFPVSYPESIGPTVAARYNELGARGIKGNLLVGHEQAMTPTTVAQRLDWIRDNVADFTTSIEGSNEFDTQGGDAARVRSLRAMQCDIYQRVKTDPVLASKLVIGPSSGNFYSDDIWYDEIGDLSACLDRGNVHPYAGSDPPHRRLSQDLSIALSWAKTVSADKPLWATETGYANAAGPTDVSEAAAATYIPRALLELFRRGVERAQVYELIDLDTGSDQAIDNYGLLRSDGSRKPAFLAMRNLLAITRDTAPASGRLGFGIVCTANCRYGDPAANPTQDGPIRHVLLKQSSGAYLLALWSESQVWDAASGTDTPQAAQSLRLSLHETPAKVEIFDPGTGTAPQSTDISGNRIIDTVASDAVRLIRITPVAAAASPDALLPAVPPALIAPVPARAIPAGPKRAPRADSARSDAGASTTCIRPKGVMRIRFRAARYPGIRAGFQRAVRRGRPRVLVLNREGEQRRSDRLVKNMRSVPGREPAAYPPAIGRGRGGHGLTRGRAPTGWRADVAQVRADESRSHRAAMMTALNRFCDGTRFRYVFE